MGTRDSTIVTADGRLTVEEVTTIDVPTVVTVSGRLSVTTADAPDVDRTWIVNGILTVVTGDSPTINGIVFDGDSLTAQGSNAGHDGPSYPGWFTTITGIPHDNIGVAGETIEQIGARFATDAAPLYDPATRNVYVLMAGANNGNAAAEMFAAAADIMADARAAGFQAWIATPPPRLSQPANIQDYIELLQTDWATIADGFIDHYTPTDSAGTDGYYLYDGLHNNAPASVRWAMRTQEDMGLAYVANDTTPSVLSFTDVTDATTETQITSADVELLGATAPVAFSIAGGVLMVNGVSAGASGTVLPYDQLALRTTSSSEFETAVEVDFDIGGVTGTWSVTTGASAGSTIAWDTTPLTGTVTLTNDDRTVVGTGSTPWLVRSTDAALSGKVLVAVTYHTNGQYYGMGLSSDASPTMLYGDANSCMYMRQGGFDSPNGGTFMNVSLAAGDTLGFVVDVVAKKLWITKDGVNFRDGTDPPRSLANVEAGVGGKDISAILDAGTTYLCFNTLPFGDSADQSGTLLTAWPWTAVSGYTYLGA